jgi:MFS transporter, DHA1 family, multidrug resistance protein
MLLTLSGMQIVIMLGFGMIAPILPLYARSFDVSTVMVGLLITSFGVARLFTNLPAGKLADRIGRRPLILAGPIVTGIGALLAGFAPTFWLLVGARFVQGLGSAMSATSSMTVLADVSTPETRGKTMSVFQGSLLLGASIGPAIGGVLAGLVGLRGVFFVYAASAFLVAIWARLRVKETLTPEAREQPSTPRGGRLGIASGATMAMMLNASFIAISLVSVAIFFTRTGARSTIVPLIGAERLGLSAVGIGNVLTVAAVFNVLVLPIAGWSIDRFGRKRTIVPSTVVSAFGVFLFAIAPNVTTFVAAAVVIGIGTGIAGPAPAAYVADLARGRSYGATMGLFRTVSDVGFVIGPVLLGWLADQRGYGFSLYVNAALLLAAGLVFAFVAKEERIRRSPGGNPEREA